MKHLVDEVIAGLRVKAVDAPAPSAPAAPAAPTKPKLQPFEEGLESTPKGLPYKDYKVMPLEAADLVFSQLNALKTRAVTLKELLNTGTTMRVATEKEIQEMEQKAGKTKLIQEIEQYKNKLGEAVETLSAEVGPVLLESNNTVLGIFEQLKGGSVTPSEKLNLLVEKIKEFASPEVAGIITKQFDAAVNAMEISRDEIKRRLVSFKPPQDLRKKVKEYIPKVSSVKEADVMQSITSFGQGLLNALKNAWNLVSDKVSTLIGTVQEAKPLLSEIETLAGEAGLEV